MRIICFTLITYVFYKGVKAIHKKWPLPFLHPLVISPLLLIALISLLNVSADQYLGDSRWLTHMLGPATVAFAIPIYKNFYLLKKHIGTILISIAAGSLTAILSSFLMAVVIKLNPDLIISVLPRSVTTPIAIEVSKEIGGLPALTTVFVILTGILGGIIGPMTLKWFRIKTPIARGLALGVGAHGVGTSKASEYGEKEMTFSTLGMILAAGMTMVWAASLIPALEYVMGILSH